MKTFREHIVESSTSHGNEILHKNLVRQGFTHRHSNGKDTYSTWEETSHDMVHTIMNKAGYHALTQSKADSRVKLPKNTHYEKDGYVGVQHHAHVHHQDGDVTHIEFRTTKTND